MSGNPLSAQPVDATPSNHLIRHYFPWRTDLFGFTRSKPSRGNVPVSAGAKIPIVPVEKSPPLAW
jgi:hypothetical protein